jgi:phosphatidylinositol alpha-1,6-mannosyltransferase
LKALLIAYDYRPKLGGVATCGYNLSKALKGNEHVEVKVVAPITSGSLEFDKNSGIDTIRVRLPDIALLSIPFFSYQIFKQIKKEKPDVLINMLWMPEGISSFFLGFFLSFWNIKLCIVAHGVEIIESSSTLRKRIRSLLSPLKKAVLRRADQIFSVSNFTGNILRNELKINSKKVCIVYNGVDSSYFEKRAKRKDLIDKFNLSDEQVIFSTITRLNENKGIDSAILALSKVKHLDFKYLVGGMGPDKERLTGLIKDNELENKVLLCGKIREEDLVDFYNLSDVNILLSRYDKETPNVEGFGLVFLEAAACGVTSLAGDSGGIRDAVKDMDTGIVVDPVDIDKISEKLRELIENKELRSSLSDSAYRWAREEMSWNDMALRILKNLK